MLTACGTAAPAPSTAPVAEGGIYTPGTYTATADGMGLVTMTATFDANSITAIELDVSNETESIGQAAKDELIKQLLEAQSNEIDGVAGASLTTSAAKSCLAKCIAQAKGIAKAEEPAKAVPVSELPEGISAEILAESAVVAEKIEKFDAEYDYDVVVVGAGTAGMPAAIAAHEAGAKVAVVQKFEFAVAQGNVGAAVIPGKSTEMGIAQFLHEMQERYNYRCDRELNMEYCMKSEEAWDWYISKLDECGYEGYSEKESLDHVYSEGNCYVKGNFFAGSMLEPTQALAEYSETLGIDIYYSTPAVQLITDNGAVIGLVAKNEETGYIRFNASKGVILATGDYQNNDAMKRRYCPDSIYFKPKQASRTGDGHLMGMLAGAQMENIVHTKMIHASGASVMRNEPLFAVNAEGKRFHAEDVLFEYRNNVVAHQPGACMFSIFDANYHDYVVGWGGDPDRSTVGNASPEALANYVEKGVVVKADTLEELCEAVGLPVEETLASVERYNALCAEGHDLDFGKESKYMKPVDTAPFYCNKREYMISALPDGLLIDVHGQCKDAEGKLIPGLFAAGNCSGCFYGTVDYSLFTMGMSVGRAVTFGYLTGKYVGENA